MMTSAAGARWRPRVRVVVVDQAIWMVCLVSLLFSLFHYELSGYNGRNASRRAVAAMVREDAREMVALAEKHIPARIHICGHGLSGGVIYGGSVTDLLLRGKVKEGVR